MKTHDLTQTQCTISSIIEVVKQTFGHDTDFWFRGQANYEHKLLPSIFRQGEGFGGKAMSEAAMIREFQQRYPDQRNKHADDNEWLSLMQHYGLPTRILDWSTNILVGIYFAIDQLNDTTKDNADGALYVLNPRIMFNPTAYFLHLPEPKQATLVSSVEVFSYLVNAVCCITKTDFKANEVFRICLQTKAGDEIVSGNYTTEMFQAKPNAVFLNHFNRATKPESITGISLKPHDKLNALKFNKRLAEYKEYEDIFAKLFRALSIPKPLRMAHLNDRIKAQHGVFTWHGGKFVHGVEVLPYMSPEDIWEDDLLKIKIPAQSKQKLLNELAYAGITKASLFPDMEHQAQSIREKYTC